MRRSIRSRSRVALRAFVAGLGLALLAASPVSAQGPTLVIAQGADITTLDPTQATQIHNLNLFYNIYDALVTWDPKDIGKVVPELAVSWRSVNPTTWQFKLRQGVKFHNGEDVQRRGRQVHDRPAHHEGRAPGATAASRRSAGGGRRPVHDQRRHQQARSPSW